MKRKIAMTAAVIGLCLPMLFACERAEPGVGQESAEPVGSKPSFEQSEVPHDTEGAEDTESSGGVIEENHVHVEEIVAAVSGTCTQPGLTEGLRCATCGATLVHQFPTAIAGHTFTEGHCTVCNAREPSAGVRYDLNEDGASYSVGHCFADGVEEIILADVYQNYPVTGISKKAFGSSSYDSSALKRVIIPEGITTIGSEAFKNCSSLTDIQLPTTLQSVAGDAFEGCSQLYETENGIQYVGNWVVGYDHSVSDVVLRPGTVGIASTAFYRYDNHSLKSIVLPSGLKYIGTDAFYYCKQLERVELPEGILSIGGRAFGECTALTSIRIPYGVTAIAESTFARCGLTEIFIPDSVTTVGAEAFSECRSLTDIVFPNGVIKLGEDVLAHCTSLTCVTIPKSLYFIPERMLFQCQSIQTVIYHGTMEEWRSMARGTYYYYGTDNFTVRCTDGELDH